ncbi:unnamed protein product, partial [marine sediment metagenome]
LHEDRGVKSIVVRELSPKYNVSKFSQFDKGDRSISERDVLEISSLSNSLQSDNGVKSILVIGFL